MNGGHRDAGLARYPPISSLVGRESELGGLLEALRRHPLVTITGAPGIGKSRLALHVADRLTAAGAGRAVVVGVAPLMDSEQAFAAVTEALELGEDLGALPGALTSQKAEPMLVVLDDCDHLVSACAEVAEMLLATDVRVLATSREPLRTPAEIVWQLAPLSLPDPLARLPEAFLESEAVQLFCERAAAAARGFIPSPDNIAAIVEICRGLDGLPLAIELAASRMGVLSPAEILAHLDDPLRLLNHGPRTAPARHQSLRTALEWSWEVLSSSEQVLLGRLSVFAGSFNAEAAHSVAAGGAVPAEAMFDVLCALVEKSLVVAEAAGMGTRYRLLRVVRHFAAEKLNAAGEASSVAARHGSWCAELVAQAGDGVRERPAWLERVEPNREEIVAAFEWAAAGGDAEAATCLGMAEVLLCRGLGDYTGANTMLERVLSLAGNAPARLRARVLYDAGAVATSQGDFALAAARLEASAVAAGEAGDAPLVARVRAMSAFVAVLVGDVPVGLRSLDNAVGDARSGDDIDCLAEVLSGYAGAHLLVGDVSCAHQAFSESRDLAGEVCNRATLANALLGCGAAAARRGDYDDAQRELTDALRMAEEVGNPLVGMMAMAELGDVARLRGRKQDAEKLLLECLRVSEEGALPYPRAKALVGLGELAQTRASLGEARKCFDAALSVAAAHDLVHLVSRCLHKLSQVERADGAEETAQLLLEQALASARGCLDKGGEARVLDELARMVAARGDDRRANSLHHEAVALRCDVGDPAEVADSLEGLAALRASSGDLSVAARLLGTAHSVRESHGCVRPEPHRLDYDSAEGLAREGLGADRFNSEWSAAEDLAVNEAVAMAAPARRNGKRPPSGREALTPAEREVARLAAAGLTNEAIAKHLVVSRRTVETHLQRTYAKLGIRSRTELSGKLVRSGGHIGS